jgi:hypothetical protein
LYGIFGYLIITSQIEIYITAFCPEGLSEPACLHLGDQKDENIGVVSSKSIVFEITQNTKRFDQM